MVCDVACKAAYHCSAHKCCMRVTQSCILVTTMCGYCAVQVQVASAFTMLHCVLAACIPCTRFAIVLRSTGHTQGMPEVKRATLNGLQQSPLPDDIPCTPALDHACHDRGAEATPESSTFSALVARSFETLFTPRNFPCCTSAYGHRKGHEHATSLSLRNALFCALHVLHLRTQANKKLRTRTALQLCVHALQHNHVQSAVPVPHAWHLRLTIGPKISTECRTQGQVPRPYNLWQVHITSNKATHLLKPMFGVPTSFKPDI